MDFNEMKIYDCISMDWKSNSIDPLFIQHLQLFAIVLSFENER